MHRNVACRSLLLPETIITSLSGTLADLIDLFRLTDLFLYVSTGPLYENASSTVNEVF